MLVKTKGSLSIICHDKLKKLSLMQHPCGAQHDAEPPWRAPSSVSPQLWKSVKGLREECQKAGRVFVFPEALFFFPLLLFSSCLSTHQLVAAGGGGALGDLDGGNSI